MVAVITISVAQVLFLVRYLVPANILFRGTNNSVGVVESNATQQGLDGSLGDVNIRPNSSERKGTRNETKFFIAFSFYEQFSMATSNLLSLTALAARSGRQVVVPFVSGSKFFGNLQTGTLDRYYNISEFNRFLRSQGLATLVTWKKFQGTCKQNLDMLLTFSKLYNIRKNGQQFYPCDVQEDIFHGFKVGKTVCFDNDFGSLEIFQQKVIKGFPCVGIKEWRGHGGYHRTKFRLPKASRKMELYHFFNTKLVQIAHDFITNNLGPDFISIHIRLQNLGGGMNRIARFNQCLSETSEEVIKRKDPRYALTVFIAGDIFPFGSKGMQIERKQGVASFYKDYLGNLNPIRFQPSFYNLTDRGSVAIVEMIILSSGKKLFRIGEGSFGKWINFQFEEKNPDGKDNIYRIC